MIETAIIIYWSKTGNTKEVAAAIGKALREEDIDVDIKKVEEAGDVDYFDYELVCLGCPSYHWSPPQEVEEFLQNKHEEFSDYIRLKAPKRPDKQALVFCTYSGPHTGKNEAIPVVKYMGQFFEHLGFNILDEICVLSEHHGSEKISTEGKMGDIRGMPATEKLQEIRSRVKNKIQSVTKS